ncbi:hypothetical protein GCM10017673_57910 [Streptosporangium violaceochromogenes]|nr:hypothetical protein GCM10017673_57910 [Streptosporangium violaceochromogenes]
MPSPMRRHVVALDGSPCSVSALRRGVTEASAAGTELLALHVIPETLANDPAHRIAGEAMMDALVDAALGGRPLASVGKEIAYGHPAEVIVDRTGETDLLLIGAAFTGAPFDGSTVAAVLRGRRCPVLVCSSPDLSDRMSWAVRLPARRPAWHR